MSVEYWTLDGAWTASGDRRFIKATIAPQATGQPNLKVTLDGDEIVAVELIKEEEDT